MEVTQQQAGSASAAAHRRIKLIASHFAATDDSPAFPSLLPMSCSSTVNLGTPRGDSMMYFARQGSSSQAFFMRQVSQEQGALPQPEVKLDYSATSKGMSVTALNRLMYSRPETIERKYQDAEEVQVQPLAQDCSLYDADPPKFARPNSIVHEQDVASYEQVSVQKPAGGAQWSPKMDIVETQSNYVVTVEVPGIGISDIRVEVNNQSLVVTGKRATQWWKITSCSSDSVSRYHKRGIVQGPYQTEWPLPADANRDAVTAQFANGILEVTIPKLQTSCA